MFGFSFIVILREIADAIQDETLMQAVDKHGTNWATIAARYLSSRTTHSLRNRYNVLRSRTSQAAGHTSSESSSRVRQECPPLDNEDEGSEGEDGDSVEDEAEDEEEEKGNQDEGNCVAPMSKCHVRMLTALPS